MNDKNIPKDWFMGQHKIGNMTLFISKAKDEKYKVHISIKGIILKSFVLLNQFNKLSEAKKELNRLIRLQKHKTYPYLK